MCTSFLIGNEKGGCLIDLTQQLFIHYINQSKYEKMTNSTNQEIIKFSDIDYLNVRYTITRGVRWGQTCIYLDVFCKDGKKKNFNVFSVYQRREDIINFIKVLRKSKLTVNDPEGLFDKILLNNERVGTIIDELDRKKSWKSAIRENKQ